MTDYGIDVEAEIIAACRIALKSDLASILHPFKSYKNTPCTRNHVENMVKTWLSFKFKTHPQMIGDYVVRCDVFNNQKSTELTVDVAVSFRFHETDELNPEGTTKYTPFIFVPITIELTGRERETPGLYRTG